MAKMFGCCPSTRVIITIVGIWSALSVYELCAESDKMPTNHLSAPTTTDPPQFCIQAIKTPKDTGNEKLVLEQCKPEEIACFFYNCTSGTDPNKRIAEWGCLKEFNQKMCKQKLDAFGFKWGNVVNDDCSCYIGPTNDVELTGRKISVSTTTTQKPPSSTSTTTKTTTSTKKPTTKTTMTKEQPTTMAKEQPTTMAKEQPTRMAKEQPTTTATFSGQPMITTAQENRSVCSSFAIWTLLVALGILA